MVTKNSYKGRLLLTLAAPFFLLNLPDLVKRAKSRSFNSSSLRVAEDLTEVQVAKTYFTPLWAGDVCSTEEDLKNIGWLQFWRGPHWSRLVPSGVLHVNWDPFRPARSLAHQWFLQNLKHKLENSLKLFFSHFSLQGRWPNLHPQSKDEDIGGLNHGTFSVRASHEQTIHFLAFFKLHNNHIQSMNVNSRDDCEKRKK